MGDTGSFAKTISEHDIYLYAGITGDFNPIHVNAEAAKNSIFKHRIAHGMLTAGLVSAVIGNVMPGPGTVYLEQNLIFKKPVFIGDTCTAFVTVQDVLNQEKGIYRLTTQVLNQDGRIVCDGYAVIQYMDLK